MKLRITLLSLLVILLLTSNASAQKEKHLFFGFNVGTKLANKNYAIRYTGLYQNQLEYALMNQYNYNQLYILLGDKNFYVPYDAYPLNMRYTPAIVTGVTIGYQVGPHLQMSLDANFSKLKVRDAFTIVVDDPGNFTTEPVIKVGELFAKEGRFDGRFNLDYVFDGTGKAKFMMGFSGLFNAWRIEEHYASMLGYKMPFFSVHNPTNNINNKVSGMGWGAGINIGIDYQINDKMVGQLVYQPYQTRVDYGFTINKTLLIQHDIVLRILWK